jgi:hypothetical protein
LTGLLSKCGKDVKLVKSYFDNASINKTEGQGKKNFLQSITEEQTIRKGCCYLTVDLETRALENGIYFISSTNVP